MESILNENVTSHVTRAPLYFVLQFKEKKQWAKIDFPYNFETFVAKARQIHPDLLNKNFTFTDQYDAHLPQDFLSEYVEMSARGVIIKIKEDIDFHRSITGLGSPMPSSTDTDQSGSTLTYISSTDETDIENSSSTRESTTYSGKRKLDDSVISKGILSNIIQKSSCGRDIIGQYNNDHFLTDKSRKTLVKIVVDHMLKQKENFKRALTSLDKCKYAEAIIEIFSNLKDPHGTLGYEQFYDPQTKTGYLASRLSNCQRGVQKIKRSCKDSEKITVGAVDIKETDEIKDAISFLKNAVPKIQEAEIIEKTKITFAYRRQSCLNEHFFQHFPRFADTPKLIDVELELLHPKIDPNSFTNNYDKFVNAIIRLYSVEKGNESIFEWDRITNSLIALTQLLPPVAREKKKASREKVSNSIEKFITFKESGTPIEFQGEEKTKQPKLIAVGPKKTAIDQYFIAVDDYVILLPTKEIVSATDYLFKASFAFDTLFDSNLSSFWTFIQFYFYGMGGAITPKIIDVHTKIHAIKENEDEALDSQLT